MFDLGARLFLLALLLTPPLPWLERVPLLIVASAGLLLPELLRSKWLWTALLALLALSLRWLRWLRWTGAQTSPTGWWRSSPDIP